VFSDDAVAMTNQISEDIKHLRFERVRFPGPTKFVAGGIEFIFRKGVYHRRESSLSVVFSHLCVQCLQVSGNHDSSVEKISHGLHHITFSSVPDTYRLARGVAPRTVLEAMTARYRSVWTPERRSRLDSLGMTEVELVTLASIVQAEARRMDEMPQIAGVYHNRLERDMLLQADPTVLYALGGYRARLLFAAIDSVADNPYNTYTQTGLPPGPIGSPGDAAIDAALHPTGDYLYFVAWPDGSHVFTRTLVEHNEAVSRARAAAQGRG
jgi:UPF0755 protein